MLTTTLRALTGIAEALQSHFDEDGAPIEVLMQGSARSVVVSTKVRPPAARAQAAASRATAPLCAASFGLGKRCGTYRRAWAG